MTTNIITATITAYCACKICCGSHAKGITANGTPPISKHTVAGSRKLKFGTTVWIKGQAYVVKDRLARRFDSRFDIYFDTHREAKQFGKQTQTVQIITK